MRLTVKKQVQGKNFFRSRSQILFSSSKRAGNAEVIARARFGTPQKISDFSRSVLGVAKSPLIFRGALRGEAKRSPIFRGLFSGKKKPVGFFAAHFRGRIKGPDFSRKLFETS